MGQVFRNLTGTEDVSLAKTRSIAQDKQGFMWFATNFGLIRYDSHTLKHYRHRSADTTSISANLLNAVFCDSRGNLWIGSTGGVDLYNRDTDTFIHIDHNLPGTNPELNNNIYFISEDRDHSILVGTPFGLNRLTLANGKVKITYILHRVFKANSQDIACVSRASNGDLWVGSLDGLIHVPEKSGTPRLFRMDRVDKSPLANEFLTLYMDDHDVIWLASSAGGLVRFDVSTETFSRVADFRDPDGHLPRVTKIMPDAKGNLWIATHSGLAYFDPLTHQSSWSVNQPLNVNSLPDNQIQTMSYDRQGGIWLGTYFFGVSYFYPNSPRFLPWPSVPSRASTGYYENAWIGRSRNNKLWVIDRNLSQLRLFDRSGGTYRSFDLQLDPALDYYSFYIDKDDKLWAAGSLVLTCYDLTRKTYQHYPKAIPGEKTKVSGRVYDLLEDSRGRFWLVGAFGALVFDKKTGQFQKFVTVTFSHSILEDAQQTIWIGGGDEVFRLKKTDRDFERIATDNVKPSSDFVTVWKLAEDRTGKIWAATRQGLRFYDKGSNRFRLDAGIRLEKIEDIRIDRRGYLWLEADSRLTRYQPNSRSVQTYSYQDGLPFNGISRPASSVEDSSGAFYFVTNKGIFRFPPQEIAAKARVSPIFLTALRVSDKEIKPGDSTHVLSKQIDEIGTLTLAHDQNIFSIDFALLNYQRSERNRYAYRLAGFDRAWTYTDNPTATYMNLPPGDYTLAVKAANGDGVWMKQQRRLAIVIRPPWWKSPYAYFLYALAIVIAGYLLIRFLWLRASLKKEHELYQAKLDFFTNISHEVRTHLSLIVGPLEKAFGLLAEDRVEKKYLTYARNNSEKLMQLVNELLDFRKIQNGSVRLQVHEYDLVKVLKNVLASFEHVAVEKAITTQFHYPEPEIRLWFDLIQLQKVFYNLLSNAFKFAPEGGRVSVEIIDILNEVTVKVTNNGRGIAPRDLPQLFDNFFQAEADQPSQKGYGIGLALSKAIVDLHQGTLTVTSQSHHDDQRGETTFRLKLLKGSEHYTRDQIAPYETVFTSYFDFGKTRLHESTGDGQERRKHTLLLVEDNDELRAMEAEIFDEEYHVLEAANGAEGLKLAFEHLPDLVLCDVMMPEENGIQVCHTLKTDIRTSHIPVILLTARTAMAQVMEGLEAGADDYLVKPFDPNVLALKINNLIKSREELRRYYVKSMAPNPVDRLIEDANSEFVARLSQFITDNMAKPGFGIDEMAAEVGMSVSVLYRKLRSLTGMTVNDFMKTVKMTRAVQLLESGNYQVNEVAMMVGYEDVRYFSKEFRKVYGKNPSQFRNQSS